MFKQARLSTIDGFLRYFVDLCLSVSLRRDERMLGNIAAEKGFARNGTFGDVLFHSIRVVVIECIFGLVQSKQSG